MRRKIGILAAVLFMAVAFVGCGAGNGAITTRNLSSDKVDDGYYFLNNGVMKYDFASGKTTKVVSNDLENTRFSKVYSFEKYLFYQEVDQSNKKKYTFRLMCADKANDYAETCLYTSDSEFWVEAEGDDLIVSTEKMEYRSPGALQDISLISDEGQAMAIEQATDGSNGAYTCADGSVINFEITKEGNLTYEVDGASYMLEASSKYHMNSVAISTSRVAEVDGKVVILLTAGKGRGYRAFYDTIGNDDFIEDILIEIDRGDYSSKVIYHSKSTKERVIGYDGAIYIYKNGAIYSSLDGKKLTKLMPLRLDADVDYEFRWIGKSLVVYDEDNSTVVAGYNK